MNYIFLKNIIDTTIENFLCQSCGNKINAESVLVTSIGPSGLGMQIVCPHCQSRSEVKAEVHAMAHEMLKTENGKTAFNAMMQKGTISGSNKAEKTDIIQDEDIRIIEKNISDARSFEDLLS